MLIWCIALFVIGVVAFLDGLFMYVETLHTACAVLLMLISVGLFVRVLLKKREGRIEKYEKEIEQLRERLEEIRDDKTQKIISPTS
jgi:membrane protein implicated in regulation of membrane protease activity